MSKKGIKQMLILSRRIGEVLVIGDNIKVTVLAIQGQQVRIGIDAPKNVEVHREEVYNRIQDEKNNQSSNVWAQPEPSSKQPTIIIKKSRKLA